MPDRQLTTKEGAIGQEFNAWLEERGYAIAVVAIGPRGTQVPIVEFLPERWVVQLVIGKRNEGQ